MPIKTMPHPKLKRDYKGKRVRTTKDVSNAFWQVPAWSLATVTEQSPKGFVSDIRSMRLLWNISAN